MCKLMSVAHNCAVGGEVVTWSVMNDFIHDPSRLRIELVFCLSSVIWDHSTIYICIGRFLESSLLV